MSARSLAGVAALLLILVSPTNAATTPPGVNLRWDRCFGDGGVSNKDFACDTNTGSERLVGSFELASTFTDMAGVEIYMDLGIAAATFPAWWAFRKFGSCRLTSLSLVTSVPPGTANCQDWSNGQGSGGIGGYSIGSIDPTRAQLQAAIAVPSTGLAQIDPGVEYLAFSLTINHAKTVGTGACVGCAEPVCISLSFLHLASPATGSDVYLSQGANNSSSQFATWQNGYPTNVAPGGCWFPLGELCKTHHVNFTCVPYSTPVRSSTWGAVKSLYR